LFERLFNVVPPLFNDDTPKSRVSELSPYAP